MNWLTVIEYVASVSTGIVIGLAGFHAEDYLLSAGLTAVYVFAAISHEKAKRHSKPE